MASKIARAYLRSIGVVLQRPHTGVELGNFSAGTGNAPSAMPYHIVMFRKTTGDSKTTVGWARLLHTARDIMADCKIAKNQDATSSDYGYYIRDIRNGNIYR